MAAVKRGAEAEAILKEMTVKPVTMGAMKPYLEAISSTVFSQDYVNYAMRDMLKRQVADQAEE